MTALLPGSYGRNRNTTMEFPPFLANRNQDRYAGVLMEDELCGSAGISAHFWVYPAAPVSRLQAAVVECGAKRDLVRWSWDFIPRDELPKILHYHVRELLMTGAKDSSYLYLFRPDIVLLLGEIYDAYKAEWNTLAASPVGDGELLHYPREFAKKQIEARKAWYEERVRIGQQDEQQFLVDVQAKELTWLLNISNDVMAATADTGVVVRKKADLTQDHRHVL